MACAVLDACWRCGSAQGIVRLPGVVEVNVAVTLGLAGLESQGCLMCVCVLRWGFPLDFWRKSGVKRSFGNS